MYLQLIQKTIFIFLFFIILISSAATEEVFLSLKKSKVNVRYGPSFDSDIKYVYKKINLPIKQIDKKENFRRIIDLKNNSGWIHVSQLKKNNSVIAIEDKILFRKPSSFAKPIAKIQKGRLLIVQNCENEWCKIKSKDYTGWIKTNDIWGLN
jgi:SH3-like domain-containing protein